MRIKARDLRRELFRLLKKYPDAILEFNQHSGMSITLLHDEDEAARRGAYYLALGYIDSEGHVHLLAEE